MSLPPPYVAQILATGVFVIGGLSQVYVRIAIS
jgi:hypothetical protein